MAVDPELRAHRDWLGLVQPTGLLVTPHALLAAQAHVDRNVAEPQARLASLVTTRHPGACDEHVVLEDIRRLCTDVLGWQDADLATPPDDLATTLAEFGETLRPTWAVADPEATDPAKRWLLLLVVVPEGCELDAPQPGTESHWNASPQARLERLLRETSVPIGLLFNGTQVRLVHAPRGETSGHATFPVSAMLEVWGRPMLSALLMLLHADRLFGGDPKRRLPAILAQSRKHQNEVSTRLSEQVLRALNELLRGVASADEASRHALLATYKDEALDEVYEGLLKVLLRLVFVLYAEDRGLTPDDSAWVKHYSVTGLFERLREDEARNPDTMDQRYGAWAQLLSLFRLLHDGASHGDRLHLPARHGRLFDPDAHPFLEGRPRNVGRVMGEPIDPPRISDGVVLRVLRDLLILDEERLSYRSLDVEEIGSIYQALMGFELRVAEGRSIGLRAGKRRLAIVVDLDALLAASPAQRPKLLDDRADIKLTGKAAEALKKATNIEELMSALERRRSPTTPDVIPLGGLYLEPTEERRRSGAHYTPRSLTAPIVETTMRPIFERLGVDATPEQILDLKVCDPAMGSGAFLVEACRVLGDRLRAAWARHGIVPPVPPDEDLDLYARRLVAQRCIYGVDKNPMAVDLAKLSLWLATLAKDHPFTFLDHSLRCGDSLVGLSRRQIEDFHWEGQIVLATHRQRIATAVERSMSLRTKIIELAAEDAVREKEELLAASDAALADVRLAADLVIEAFFAETKDRARKVRLQESAELVERWLTGELPRSVIEERAEGLRNLEHPAVPFHWELEYPEVFARENGGFDALVGNPPFLGGTRISTVLSMGYFEWLAQLHQGAGHLCDLVAHFLRRSFRLLSAHGTLGLICTNTVSQGDTRDGGLRALVSIGGHIYSATTRLAWPGEAAVVVSVVHVSRSPASLGATLDGRAVARISAYLVPGTVSSAPCRLSGRNALFSAGSKIYGQGFLFDDSTADGTPRDVAEQLVRAEPRYGSRIKPYLGGEEINSSPTCTAHRLVMDLNDVPTEGELWRDWPALAHIVERLVKPERMKLGPNPNNTPLRRRWWAYQAHRPGLYRTMSTLTEILVASQVSKHWALAPIPTTMILAHTVNVFLFSSRAAFAIMQSRPHEVWARFFGSSMKDDLRYTPSDCFETFPFPPEWEGRLVLESIGKAYYEHRAALMVNADEGLTKTYNRFHDPEERDPSILRLRELHTAMDRAVLDAYGWTDIPTDCEFIADYEEEDDDGNLIAKSIRLRWPDAVRDEVLARLLKLNQERAEAERLAAAAGTTAPATQRRGRKKEAYGSEPGLFD